MAKDIDKNSFDVITKFGKIKVSINKKEIVILLKTGKKKEVIEFHGEIENKKAVITDIKNIPIDKMYDVDKIALELPPIVESFLKE